MGRRGRYIRYAKVTTELQKSFSVSWLRKNRMLVPGKRSGITWRSGDDVTGSIGVLALEDGLILEFRYREGGEDWQNVTQWVQFTWTPCRFGGHRTWFVCPGCGRRVGVLYGAGLHFKCRKCHRLGYESQRENDLALLFRRLQKAWEPLGGEPMRGTPPKPKYMRWNTYLRLLREGRRLQAAYGAAFGLRAERVERYVDAALRQIHDPTVVLPPI